MVDVWRGYFRILIFYMANCFLGTFLGVHTDSNSADIMAREGMSKTIDFCDTGKRCSNCGTGIHCFSQSLHCIELSVLV